MKNTNWSQPKTNILKGMLSLKSALAYGHKAKLIRMLNEDCEYPRRISGNVLNKDFRCYEFSVGYATCIDEINKTSRSEFSKYLSLNYVSVYGSEEAVKSYYETGKLSKDNLLGMGKGHLVLVDDLIKFLETTGEYQRANMYKLQYRNPQTTSVASYFDFYILKNGKSTFELQKFKHKLWVVQLLDDSEETPSIPLLVKILNILMYPLKYIPTKSVLKMPEYTNIGFRVGSIINGFRIEFQIPKKFSFK